MSMDRAWHKHLMHRRKWNVSRMPYLQILATSGSIPIITNSSITQSENLKWYNKTLLQYETQPDTCHFAFSSLFSVFLQNLKVKQNLLRMSSSEWFDLNQFIVFLSTQPHVFQDWFICLFQLSVFATKFLSLQVWNDGSVLDRLWLSHLVSFSWCAAW